jgi:hypothetical protein
MSQQREHTDIKASDLRIGNIVHVKGHDKMNPHNSVIIELSVSECRVSNDSPVIGMGMACSYDNIEGIPLTSEILKKCQPKYTPTYNGFSFDFGKLSIHLPSGSYFNGRTYFNSWCIMERIPVTLHEFQNLVYALTQTELTVKL